MLRLLLLAALCSSASAQVGVRAAFPTDANNAFIFLGAADLDGDGTNEIVHGTPWHYTLSRLLVRDGVTGEVEWDSTELGDDLDIRIAGWTHSSRDVRYGDSIGLTYNYGASPFADVDGDGQLELVFVDIESDRMYVIGGLEGRVEAR